MRYKIKYILLSIVIVLSQLVLIESALAQLSCSVTNSCADSIIFKMSSLTNAHAETDGSSNYLHKVCCKGTGFTVGTSCDTGVKVTRIVVYNGQPVKLVVAACG